MQNSRDAIRSPVDGRAATAGFLPDILRMALDYPPPFEVPRSLRPLSPLGRVAIASATSGCPAPSRGGARRVGLEEVPGSVTGPETGEVPCPRVESRLLTRVQHWDEETDMSTIPVPSPSGATWTDPTAYGSPVAFFNEALDQASQEL